MSFNSVDSQSVILWQPAGKLHDNQLTVQYDINTSIKAADTSISTRVPGRLDVTDVVESLNCKVAIADRVDQLGVGYGVEVAGGN